MSRILPEEAVSLARCWLHRWRRDGREAFGATLPAHAPCIWCDYPADYVFGRLREFNEEAGYNVARDRYADDQVDAFTRLPYQRQRALVERFANGEEMAP